MERPCHYAKWRTSVPHEITTCVSSSPEGFSDGFFAARLQESSLGQLRDAARHGVQLSFGEPQWTSTAEDSVATAGNVKGVVLMLYGFLGSKEKCFFVRVLLSCWTRLGSWHVMAIGVRLRKRACTQDELSGCLLQAARG